jgi:hypothetical protein
MHVVGWGQQGYVGLFHDFVKVCVDTVNLTLDVYPEQLGRRGLAPDHSACI